MYRQIHIFLAQLYGKLQTQKQSSSGELLADKIRPTLTIVVERQRKETTNRDQTLPPSRRNGREIRLLAHYRENGEANIVVTNGGEDDLLTYKMAMDDVDQEKWQKAMKLEMEFMYSNSV